MESSYDSDLIDGAGGVGFEELPELLQPLNTKGKRARAIFVVPRKVSRFILKASDSNDAWRAPANASLVHYPSVRRMLSYPR